MSSRWTNEVTTDNFMHKLTSAGPVYLYLFTIKPVISSLFILEAVVIIFLQVQEAVLFKIHNLLNSFSFYCSVIKSIVVDILLVYITSFCYLTSELNEKMIPDNVTLIVKAPNQQIEDQNVECQSSWTVGQLKGHLSEVYPNKPKPEEQKIIYSGQLLKDNIILKDVLRTYESQIAHTMHLVCAPNKKMPEIRPTPTQEGLRRRIDPETPRPEMRQNDQNHTVEMQNYLSSFVNNYGRVPPYPNMGEGYLPVNNDPAAMANHMMMMQQAYLQYMQQYANMWQATQPPPPQAEPPRPPPPADPPAPEDNEEAARDWLDHIYAASRLAILSSLVYLYGSGARLLLVLVLVVAGYLHQIGFFRDLNLNQRNNNQRNPPAENQNQQPENQNQQPENQNQQADNQNQQPDNQNQLPDNQNLLNQHVGDNQQSLLAVTWMIFSSFFASLIPDVNQ